MIISHPYALVKLLTSVLTITLCIPKEMDFILLMTLESDLLIKWF